MKTPLEKNGEQAKHPTCLDVSPERLHTMSPSELADAMEEALEFMTAESYRSDIINAYLDELDRRTPMPEYPNAEDAYSSFQQKMASIFVVPTVKRGSKPAYHPPKFRQAIRIGLTAAVLVACLFGSMIVVQASGVDIFGAIARWTSGQFSFGSDFNDEAHYFPSSNGDSSAQAEKTALPQEIPEEYKELQVEMNARDLSFFVPNIPTEFVVEESSLYIDPMTETVEFYITYIQGTDCIGFNLTQTNGNPSNIIYEKDNGTVELYTENGISYYLFTNNGNTVLVWRTENIEYSLHTNSSSIKIKDLI